MSLLFIFSGVCSGLGVSEYTLGLSFGIVNAWHFRQWDYNVVVTEECYPISFIYFGLFEMKIQNFIISHWVNQNFRRKWRTFLLKWLIGSHRTLELILGCLPPVCLVHIYALLSRRICASSFVISWSCPLVMGHSRISVKYVCDFLNSNQINKSWYL